MSKLFLNLYNRTTIKLFFQIASMVVSESKQLIELSTHWTVMGVNKLYFGMHATNT